MRIDVPDTDLSFERASFTGREYREYTRANAELKYIDEMVEKTLSFVVKNVTKGGVAYSGDLMDLDWYEEVMPIYYEAAQALIPKGPPGTTTEES